MKKLAIISLSAVVAGSAFVGCNSDYTPTEYTSTNVIVSSFSLTQDDSILKGLDTVAFSIDLVRGRIFNADSLPYGTKINKLVPVIRVYESASAITLRVPRANGSDTTINYIENSTDSIDFSNGPVLLEVTSFSGTNSLQYRVEVNVHKEIGDTMVWTDAATAPLSTELADPTAQKTVRNANGLYTLTGDGSAFSLMHAQTPESEWQPVATAIPDGADVSSFTASDNTFYIIAAGQLYYSSDASAWTPTGQMWDYIYGIYSNHAIGSSKASGEWKFVQYPSKIAPSDIPADMPVCGTSALIEYSIPMSELSQAFFTGGERADGSLTNATWAFAGTSWTEISLRPISEPLKGMTIVPFYNYLNSKENSKIDVILAFGGTDAEAVSRKVYMTYDFGMTWYKAPVSMQLPKPVPASYNAQAYTFESVFGSRAASAWTPLDLGYRIPATAVSAPWHSIPSGRATEIVTTWNVPFIYTFGGIKGNGQLERSVWKATVNRLTFKPII